uniref:Magnetosome protein MamS/MamX domain-containing protein n=1 Tax=Geobacter metallireducens TaxID=28232 RepID=A0A831XEI3_GEOME
MVLMLLFFGQVTHADAGWGFGQGWGWRKGGLNLDMGYDMNTVVAVTGEVKALIIKDDRHTFVEVRTKDEPVFLVLGPQWYWERHGIALRPGDMVSAWGSKALDEDGSVHIIAQRVINRTTGSEVILRSQSGKPVWSAGGGRGRGK